MRFFTDSHQHYCGVDLHARSMYLCILDHHGEVVLHRNLPAEPDASPRCRRTVSRRSRRRCRVHLHLVLARRSLRRAGYPVYPRTRIIHEGHPRRESKERPHRFPQDRRPHARRHIPHGLCLSRGHAGHQRSAQKTQLPDPQTGRSAQPHPEQQQPVQHGTLRLADHPTRPTGRPSPNSSSTRMSASASKRISS